MDNVAPQRGGWVHCDISLENTPTSHAVSLALFCTLAVVLHCLFCHALAYAIAANGVCLPSSHTVLLLQCFLLI